MRLQSRVARLQAAERNRGLYCPRCGHTLALDTYWADRLPFATDEELEALDALLARLDARHAEAQRGGNAS